MTKSQQVLSQLKEAFALAQRLPESQLKADLLRALANLIQQYHPENSDQ